MRFAATLSYAVLAAALPVCAFAQTPSSPAPAASPVPAGAAAAHEDPAVTKTARTELDAFLAGKIDRSHYAAGSAAQLTDAIVTRISDVLKSGGKVTSFGYLGPGTLQGMAVVQYAIGFDHAIALPNGSSSKDFVEDLILDKAGKVAVIFFAPKGM